MNYVVGVDIGGTNIEIAIFDHYGEMLSSVNINTRRENNGEYIPQDVVSTVRKLVADRKISTHEILGIGVGVPGPVVDDRVTVRCVNLGCDTKDLASLLEKSWVGNVE